MAAKGGHEAGRQALMRVNAERKARRDAGHDLPQTTQSGTINPEAEPNQSVEPSALDRVFGSLVVDSVGIVGRILHGKLKVPNSKRVDVALRLLEGRGYLGAGQSSAGQEHGEALARLELALGRRAAVTINSVVDAVIIEPAAGQDE